MIGRIVKSGLAIGTLLLGVQAVAAETKIKFALDWIPGSVHAPFMIAQQKGYYKAEGLDVQIDPGKGSGEVVRQLASGLYDMGYPDINILMEFVAKNPDQGFPVVMSGYEQAPAAIFTLKSSGITEPKQLAGKKLGSAAHDSTFKLFPAFAQLNGLDPNSVQVQYIEPNLREVLLTRRDVDAIPGQFFNSYIMLKSKGVKEDEISYFMYNEHGLALYGNSIAVSRKFLKENPDAVRGFLRATVKGVRDMVRDPEEGVKAALAYQPLLNADVERERLNLALKCCIATENVLKDGYGVVDMDRLRKDIDVIAKAYNLPRAPGVEEIYNPSFLPSQQDRLVR
ncbi:ABC transporter substrate-binding protein [Hansschlegelia sp.]|uniref:ABC transporter substrate-binding protein n=1 Tax=Hansschlegelia sp. TaxID=2041892 RepID=UPI002BF6442E|nr:ABC transporter substrate-binding protein [Hansschlegelia sp.]HVI27090.1 ABC transporter substrate-binding protein [Hansschlegelia sp.]